MNYAVYQRRTHHLPPPPLPSLEWNSVETWTPFLGRKGTVSAQFICLIGVLCHRQEYFIYITAASHTCMVEWNRTELLAIPQVAVQRGYQLELDMSSRRSRCWDVQTRIYQNSSNLSQIFKHNINNTNKTLCFRNGKVCLVSISSKTQQ